MWFSKLIIQFFFSLDKIIYSFIPEIYDLLITISRTTILSQSDINDFYQRIYMLLAIFMLFKVGFSLITYVVNPDDFSDKNKGIGKIVQNVLMSLCMLVLVPYAFSMAYELQSIILKENILGHIIFGEDKSNYNPISSAGDDMAFIALSTFVTPNTNLDHLKYCSKIYDNKTINSKCFGVKIENDKVVADSRYKNDSMYSYVASGDLDEKYLNNYVFGLHSNSVGLMFRSDLLKATAILTSSNDEEFIINYNYFFSTVVGVVIILLLLGFCLDVALRSVKLAFLQIIAPIPIISFIDPKSGKDGIFKKWYKMCFSTFLSLFIRLLALYLAIYIIGQVSNGMSDVITGASVTSGIVKIFIIIGVLMFAKQLPKILEGLGIKIDGDGKFNLNPLKKIENEAFGGKTLSRVPKAAVGGAMGLEMGYVGALTGAGAGRIFTGMAGGLSNGLKGKKIGEIHKGQIDANSRMRKARLEGSTLGGRLGTRISDITGSGGELARIEEQKEQIETQQKRYDDQIKSIEDRIAPTKRQIADQKRFADAIKSMETRAKEEIQNGNGGAIGTEYLKRKAEFERLKNSREATADEIAEAEASMTNYLNDVGMKAYMTAASADDKFDRTFTNMRKNAEQAGTTIGITLSNDGKTIHGQFGATKGDIGDLERSIYADEQQIESIKLQKAELGDEMRDINRRENIAKANQSAIKK